MPRPRVSVVMPVLNREVFLSAAIDSILQQTFSDWELLISDGGSIDATRSILARYAAVEPRIRWFDHPGLNIPKARNALLREAQGEYIAVLDSDDIALPQRLQIQSDYLNSFSLVGVGSNLKFIDESGDPVQVERYPLRLTDPTELRQRLLEGWGVFAHTSMMLHRQTVVDIGGYREIFRHAEDDDLFLRLLEKGDMANITQPLAAYRCSEDNAHRPGRELHRAVALASAHLRLIGEVDPVELRREPFDHEFLQDLLRRLGDRALQVRLFWIGMLQHYGIEPQQLPDQWHAVLHMKFQEEMNEEIKRHWKNYHVRFPELHAKTVAKFLHNDSTAPSCIWDKFVHCLISND